MPKKATRIYNDNDHIDDNCKTEKDFWNDYSIDSKIGSAIFHPPEGEFKLLEEGQELINMSTPANKTATNESSDGCQSPSKDISENIVNIITPSDSKKIKNKANKNFFKISSPK